MDSARLPALSSSDTQEEAEAAGGDASIEKSLTRIWKKALGRSHIGSNENFFDAGGTSLKAVVVVAMIRKELKKKISIVALFESPTIALLAARLDESKAAEGASAAAASAESRGRQRRNKLVKRRVA
jgi:surfactin family lipopeptide synthetase B